MLCLLRREITLSKAPQSLWFLPAPKHRWFCTSFQCHQGHRNALGCPAVVILKTVLYLSTVVSIVPLLFVLRSAFLLRLDTHPVERSAPCRSSKTRVGTQWMERNDSVRPMGTELGIAAWKWERKRSSQRSAWPFKLMRTFSKETVILCLEALKIPADWATREKTAKQSHRNPRRDLDNYWLPYIYDF